MGNHMFGAPHVVKRFYITFSVCSEFVSSRFGLLFDPAARFDVAVSKCCFCGHPLMFRLVC